MTSRANNWGEAEVVCLISIWQEKSVADILDGKDRNNKAYEIMAEKMKEVHHPNGCSRPEQSEGVTASVDTS